MARTFIDITKDPVELPQLRVEQVKALLLRVYPATVHATAAVGTTVKRAFDSGTCVVVHTRSLHQLVRSPVAGVATAHLLQPWIPERPLVPRP
jgi:hypothetical protein